MNEDKCQKGWTNFNGIWQDCRAAMLPELEWCGPCFAGKLNIVWDPTGIRMVRKTPWWVRGITMRRWWLDTHPEKDVP